MYDMICDSLEIRIINCPQGLIYLLNDWTIVNDNYVLFSMLKGLKSSIAASVNHLVHAIKLLLNKILTDERFINKWEANWRQEYYLNWLLIGLG